MMGLCYLISEEEVAAAIKGLKMGKAAGLTGVVSEMMKSSGGCGSRWMTDLINSLTTTVRTLPSIAGLQA